MAKKKQVLTKKQQKQIKKFAKKNPKVFAIALVIFIVIAAIGVGAYVLYKKSHEHKHEPIESGEVQINFLELGNDRIGDSTFIQVGNVDILIDAGSRRSSAETIENFMKERMSDNKIEYVIATHAHEDHIAGFVGTTGKNAYGGIFDHFDIGTLIQFDRADTTSTLYSEYCTKVETLKSKGTKVYKASECVKNPFTLDDKIYLEILDQKYYYEKSSTENNYSVCALLSQGDNHYLFTGDLEKSGEESLVAKNNLPHCELFKGGHHGSETSNNDCLLDVITPDNICICTCCGSDEYASNPALFPNQITIDRMAKHTDKIYVTASYQDKVYQPMNGNITFKCKNGVDYEIHGSNNDTILKDTDWFKAHRTWPNS